MLHRILGLIPSRQRTSLQNSAVPTYDQKYSRGGWQYKAEKERPGLKVMIDAAGLEPPASIIEIACGQGFHANLLHQMGFDIVGNDASEIGIRNARAAYPHIRFICGDSRELADSLGAERFDALIVRGHTHHHYDLPLSGKSKKRVDVFNSTRTMFDLVRPGGVVVVTIKTDFSGEWHSGGILNNRADAYRNLFSQFGTIIFLGDRHGTVIEGDAHAHELGRKPNNRVVVVTKKPQH